MLRTKYLQFFEVSTCTTLSSTAVKETPGAWILDSAADNPCRPHTRLLPIAIVPNKVGSHLAMRAES